MRWIVDVGNAHDGRCASHPRLPVLLGTRALRSRRFARHRYRRRCNVTDRLLDLASRCEQAMGPDQALDRDIRRAIQIDAAPSNFTHSIDAATTLVPEGWCWGLFDEPRAWLWPTPTRDLLTGIQAKAATPTLALCAAALRARASGMSAGTAETQSGSGLQPASPTSQSEGTSNPQGNPGPPGVRS
jgi:hypothetical protein